MQWFYPPTTKFVGSRRWLLFLASLLFFDATAQAATFTVTNRNDSGVGSLRQAVLNATAAIGNNTINFQAGLTGTITLTSGEIAITTSLTIDGPGANLLTISGNNASRIFNCVSPAATIQKLTLSSGKSDGDGGGIFNSGILTLNKMVLQGNKSIGGSGGAIYSSGSLTANYVTIAGNSATSNGGGYSGGTLKLNNSTVAYNQCDGIGGGIHAAGTTTVVNSTISNNLSHYRGGGVYSSSSTTITNSTISSNVATSAGGGIYIEYINTSSYVTLGNSIVAGNGSADGNEIGYYENSFYYVSSAGTNLIGANGNAGIGRVTLDATDIVLAGDISNAIADLADNGGLTQTQALVVGSPAINAGNSTLIPAGVTTDQRGTGFARIVGTKVDIGAYEYGAGITMYALTVTKTGTGTVTSAPAGINCGATCSANFASGTSVVLTATPSSATFTGWGGACSGTATTCTVAMTAAKTVSAGFALPNHTLTVSVTGAGTGTVKSAPVGINSCSGQCSASFTQGSNVTLTATAGAGSALSGWGGVCTGTAATCVVAMTAPKTASVVFNASTNLPDFVVTSVILTPGAPVAGDGFKAAITVKNQGALAGAAGNLVVWANQATNQTCGATGDKTVAVAALAAGASATFTVTGLVAGARGNQTLRALVDAACVTTETNEVNNQFTKTYRVAGVTGMPDVTVTAITFAPATGTANGSFSATVTVSNQGGTATDGGYLDVWADQSALQRCGAEGDAWADVGNIAAGASKTFTVTGLNSGAAGTKTVRAFVDSWCEIVESNETNNQLTKAYSVQ